VPFATTSELSCDGSTLPIGVLAVCAFTRHGFVRTECAGAISHLSHCKQQKNLLIRLANEPLDKRQLLSISRIEIQPGRKVSAKRDTPFRGETALLDFHLAESHELFPHVSLDRRYRICS
jgi:hypothetical protein